MAGGIEMVWEYKTVKLRVKGFWGGTLDQLRLDGMMNELGREGWELAAALPATESYGRTRDVVVIFKRPKAG